MRKLSLVLAIFMLVSTFAVVVNAAAAVNGKKTVTAYVADINVDGVVDETWYNVPAIHVDVVKENASAWFGDTSKVSGVDYATADAKVLWNGSDTLYILYAVSDKVISLVGENPWDRDSVEIFIDYSNDTDDPTVDVQARIMADGVNELSNQYIKECAWGEYGSGFVYEIALDVSEVSGGNYFGIDFQYNDDAMGDGVRAVCLGWSDSTDRASTDATVYGQCELSETTLTDYLAAIAAELPEQDTANDESVETDTSAGTPVETEDAPVTTAPVTSDAGIVAAAAVMAVAAGVVLSKKH